MPNPFLARVARAAMSPKLQCEHDATVALRDDATLIATCPIRAPARAAATSP